MKKDLLLLHGALGTKTLFDPIRQELADHFNVFDLDFSGHGGKPVNDEFGMPLFAREILEFLDHHDLGAVHVFGYSMGGYAALWAARIHPERFLSILTLGTKFDWSPEAAEKEIRMLNPEKMEEKVPAFAARLKDLHDPGDWKKLVRHTADMMRELGSGKNLTDHDLKQIHVPVFVGIGDQDEMVSLFESRQAAGHLSNGQLTILPNTRHALDKTDPRTIASWIRERIG